MVFIKLSDGFHIVAKADKVQASGGPDKMGKLMTPR